mmetsp:Transcript_20953/g.34927  ORF Transcript_20953/g.34927 Transcript_20953/m.34927 type:complete len:232 (-) Transcript_20953:747-1442(-)
MEAVPEPHAMRQDVGPQGGHDVRLHIVPPRGPGGSSGPGRARPRGEHGGILRPAGSSSLGPAVQIAGVAVVLDPINTLLGIDGTHACALRPAITLQGEARRTGCMHRRGCRLCLADKLFDLLLKEKDAKEAIHISEALHDGLHLFLRECRRNGRRTPGQRKGPQEVIRAQASSFRIQGGPVGVIQTGGQFNSSGLAQNADPLQEFLVQCRITGRFGLPSLPCANTMPRFWH